MFDLDHPSSGYVVLKLWAVVLMEALEKTRDVWTLRPYPRVRQQHQANQGEVLATYLMEALTKAQDVWTLRPYPWVRLQHQILCRDENVEGV